MVCSGVILVPSLGYKVNLERKPKPKPIESGFGHAQAKIYPCFVAAEQGYSTYNPATTDAHRPLKQRKTLAGLQGALSVAHPRVTPSSVLKQRCSPSRTKPDLAEWSQYD